MRRNHAGPDCTDLIDESVGPFGRALSDFQSPTLNCLRSGLGCGDVVAAFINGDCMRQATAPPADEFFGPLEEIGRFLYPLLSSVGTGMITNRRGQQDPLTRRGRMNPLVADSAAGIAYEMAGKFIHAGLSRPLSFHRMHS